MVFFFWNIHENISDLATSNMPTNLGLKTEDYKLCVFAEQNSFSIKILQEVIIFMIARTLVILLALYIAISVRL